MPLHEGFAMSLQDTIKELDAGSRRLLEAYMSLVERLDSVLAVLTRPYCAHCPRNADYGCCDFAAEAVREMPVQAIKLQEAECLQNGGALREVGGICRYHTSHGCSLRLTKSSSCLGHLCGDLKERLAEANPQGTEPFIVAMGKLVSGSLQQDSAALFVSMGDAIALGNALLGKKGEPGTAA
jgi:hypothetical protein